MCVGEGGGLEIYGGGAKISQSFFFKFEETFKLENSHTLRNLIGSEKIVHFLKELICQ